MTIKTPSREEVNRQLRRIRKEKEKVNSRKNAKKEEISNSERRKNVDRLQGLVQSLDFESEVQSQTNGCLVPHLGKGDELIVSIDRFSRAGNALVELPNNEKNHINLGRIDCEQGDDVAIEITEIADTFVRARPSFIWESHGSDQPESPFPNQKESRISDIRPGSTGLNNRNDLLGGHQ